MGCSGAAGCCASLRAWRQLGVLAQPGLRWPALASSGRGQRVAGSDREAAATKGARHQSMRASGVRCWPKDARQPAPSYPLLLRRDRCLLGRLIVFQIKACLRLPLTRLPLLWILDPALPAAVGRVLVLSPPSPHPPLLLRPLGDSATQRPTGLGQQLHLLAVLSRPPTPTQTPPLLPLRASPPSTPLPRLLLPCWCGDAV